MKFQIHQHISLRDAHAVHSQRGLTLLEVLIALLVLSIGLIGAAVLTVQSLQNTHSALYTSLASAAALDLEERLWIDLGRIEHPHDSIPTVGRRGQVDFDESGSPDCFTSRKSN